MSLAPAIVSMGVCTCAGAGVEKLWTAVLDGNPLFKKQELFVSQRYGERIFGMAEQKSPKASKKLSECGKLLLSALDEAFESFSIPKESQIRSGLFLGTSIGGVFEAENLLSGSAKSLGVLAGYECSYLAEFSAKRLGIKGICQTFSTACSSSGIAMASACNSIISGELDIAVVCGVDSLSRTTVNGFGSLLLLSDSVSKPFDSSRDGINLGEGAGVIVLTSQDYAKKNSLEILSYLNGWSCTADAYHATAPHPNGDGAMRAMRIALNSAGIKEEDVSYYCAHGTGTQGNDVAESAAIKNVFGSGVNFSSLKGVIGHTLGASGIINAIISVCVLKNNLLPLNAGFSSEDEKCGISPLAENKTLKVKNVLFSSFGFGGNNACAVVSQNKESSASFSKKDFYIYAGSELTSKRIELSELLKEIPQLKKRKWSKLQQIALQLARSLPNVKGIIPPEKLACVWGTGLAMTDEIEKFVGNVITKSEAEPMPTSFINSVHNAPSSLLAIIFGLQGLNSAVTAKEISFESALKQAYDSYCAEELNAAFVGAGDIYSKFAERFMCEQKHIEDFAMCESSSMYLCAGKELMDYYPADFKINGIFIRRRSSSSKSESEYIEKQLCECGIDKKTLSRFFVPSELFGFNRRFIMEIGEFLGVDFTLLNSCGENYSISGRVFSEAKKYPKGSFAMYNLSSTGLGALTIFESV